MLEWLSDGMLKGSNMLRISDDHIVIFDDLNIDISTKADLIIADPPFGISIILLLLQMSCQIS